MGNVVIILGLCLVLLTFRYIRQRIEDRRNEELNRSIRRVSEKSKKSARNVKVVRDLLDIDMKNISAGVHPVGDISKLKREPKDGDVGSLHGRSYFYYNGKWEEIAGLI